MEAWATERFNGSGQVLNYGTVSPERFLCGGGEGQFNIFPPINTARMLDRMCINRPHQISTGLIILPAVTEYIGLKGIVHQKLKFHQCGTHPLVNRGTGDIFWSTWRSQGFAAGSNSTQWRVKWQITQFTKVLENVGELWCPDELARAWSMLHLTPRCARSAWIA